MKSDRKHKGCKTKRARKLKKIGGKVTTFTKVTKIKITEKWEDRKLKNKGISEITFKMTDNRE